MEELSIKYQQLKSGLKQLRRMLIKYQQAFRAVSTIRTDVTEDEYMTCRDALIKRFEFCYDLTWKFLKTVLKVHYSIESNSPRKVFNDSYMQKIINEVEVRTLIDMIDARNETAHVYDELRADAVGQKIATYVELLNAIEVKCAKFF